MSASPLRLLCTWGLSLGLVFSEPIYPRRYLFFFPASFICSTIGSRFTTHARMDSEASLLWPIKNSIICIMQSSYAGASVRLGDGECLRRTCCSRVVGMPQAGVQDRETPLRTPEGPAPGADGVGGAMSRGWGGLGSGLPSGSS